MMQILKAYMKHQQTLSRLDIKPVKPVPFKLNNKAIATMCNFEHNPAKSSATNTTAWRHVQRLIEAKLISTQNYKIVKGKVIFKKDNYSGTNGSYEVEINPKILVAAPNYEYAQALLKSKGIDTVSVENLHLVNPSFSAHPLGCVSFCYDIATNLSQELNINIDKESVENTKTTDNSTLQANAIVLFSQEQGSVDASSVQGAPKTQGKASEPQFSEKGIGARKNENSALKTSLTKRIEIMALMAWNFAYSVLWNGKIISQKDKKN
ncbi:MAG: hypothetical protein WC707_06825, partial [Candidatus Babeliaceae bacterium]